jgi:hypothetical protein
MSGKTTPRATKATQAEFEEEFETLFNGLPNMWSVNISMVDLLKPLY